MGFRDAAARRVGGRHVQVFVPSVDRDGDPIPGGQEHWMHECLAVMGRLFGGATAFPPAKGVWRDDDRDGSLVFEDIVVVFSFVPADELTLDIEDELLEFLFMMGRETNQGEIGILVDGDYYGYSSFDQQF
jgi:hypothetical protein